MNGCGGYTHLPPIFFTNHTILPFPSSSSSSSFFPCFQFLTKSMASLHSLASTTSPSSPHLLHPSSTKPKLSHSLHTSAFSSFHGRSLSLSTTNCQTLTRRTYRKRPWNPILMVQPKIQFIQGTDEQTVPDVRLTKSRDGTNGMAIFRFDQPSVFDSSAEVGDITGFYMIDEEGVIQSVDVNAKFINGKPAGIEAKYVMRTPREWDRFMRFMERYSNANGLQFVKK